MDFYSNEKILLTLNYQIMKKLLLSAAFSIAGFVSAKNLEVKTNFVAN